MNLQEDHFSMIASYYTKHRQEVLGYVLRCIPSATEAEDIVQDVFLRLLQSKKMLTEITLPSLVNTTAKHLIIDHWRRHAIRNDFKYQMTRNVECDENDGAAMYDAKEMEAFLEHSIAKLDKNLQRVYRLHISEGAKVAEISQRLQLGYKCVEKRLGLARRIIRNEYRQTFVS